MVFTAQQDCSPQGVWSHGMSFLYCPPPTPCRVIFRGLGPLALCGLASVPSPALNLPCLGQGPLIG